MSIRYTDRQHARHHHKGNLSPGYIHFPPGYIPFVQFTVDLPKKHGRGGQSALRFARLRMEKRHNYVRKVAETAVQCFIKDDKVACANLILAGSADFKTELNGSDMFDQRLQVSSLV